MEETKNPAMTERRPVVDNVVPSLAEFQSIIALNITRATEQMVAKETSTFVADSLHKTLQCSLVSSVVYSVVEQVLFDLFPHKVLEEILNKLIVIYFHTDNVVDKICVNSRSTKNFIAPVAEIIQRSLENPSWQNASRRGGKAAEGSDTGVRPETRYTRGGVIVQLYRIGTNPFAIGQKMRTLKPADVYQNTVPVPAAVIDPWK